MQNKWDFIHPIDSMNLYRLIDIINLNGFPNKRNMGEKNFENECVSMAAYAVLLHNSKRIMADNDIKNILLAEVEKGNLNRNDLAGILDKYYWKKDEFGNSMVLYGSQFGKLCLKNRKKSDSVRADIGLPALHDSMFIKCKTEL